MSEPAIDITSLSEDQQLALQQFTSVTDQELNTAVPLLQKCQWNAQIAITRFFDGDVDTVDPAAEAAQAPPPPPSQSARRTETLMDSIPRSPTARSPRRGGAEAAPRVVPTPESQMSQQLPFPFSILLLPFNLTYTIFQRVLGAVGYVFPFLPRLLSRFWSGRASHPSRDSGRRPLSPRDTAARFMREFEEEYGVTHGTLPFHEGGYAQAFDVAKRDLKYLLVLLLSPEHDDTAPFVRDTLLAPEFVEFVKEPSNNIVLWAGTVQDAEAYQVASALNVTRFPYACLIVHTPSVSSTAMGKITSSAGPVAAPDLIQKLQAAMQERSQELERIRRQRQEQQATRDLRQEQESAYERSLAADREKARKRKEEEAAKEKAEREGRELAERKAEEARKLAQWQRWRAQSVPSEPDAEVKDAVRISLRLPSGERVIRKFRAEADLEELYAFVECYDLPKADADVFEKGAQEPPGYEHEYKFQLVSPMPREVYDLEKGGSVRERIGRSGNLIVEKTVQDDDEDEEEEER
ncbi:UBX-domain-containing protein [Hortaea werneckii]|nr:UBX-domain-containing protein [Hortaea werneckii]